MTVATPSIHILLRAFFEPKMRRAKTERRERLMYIDKRLRRYLESDVPGRLCGECNALIAAERQFNPYDVVARLFDARVLLANLPGFLMPDHLPADALPRRTQFEVVRGLGRMLAEDDLVCEGDYRAFEAALARVVQRPPNRGRRR
ncbi:hypothetical protein [Agreia bicolorata]|nr:hypothetical protein [Agreia bicolorata]